MPRQTYCPLEKARETWSLTISLEGVKKKKKMSNHSDFQNLGVKIAMDDQ